MLLEGVVELRILALARIAEEVLEPLDRILGQLNVTCENVGQSRLSYLVAGNVVPIVAAVAADDEVGASVSAHTLSIGCRIGHHVSALLLNNY